MDILPLDHLKERENGAKCPFMNTSGPDRLLNRGQSSSNSGGDPRGNGCKRYASWGGREQRKATLFTV